jgi:hypothetical protein
MILIPKHRKHSDQIDIKSRKRKQKDADGIIGAKIKKKVVFRARNPTTDDDASQSYQVGGS